jgi:3-hydroxyisobutyrate dehydrogenase-like beta-hydroxyacid dehydrogenase
MGTDVTVLGAGLMGSAVARALMASGRTVTVWNRTTDKTRPLADAGAQVAGTVGEALKASPVTIVVLVSYEAVREVLDEAVAISYRGDVVNFTTGVPRDADELGGWAAETKIPVIDTAVLAYPSQIGDVDSSVGRMYFSGDAAAWQRCQDVLASLSGTTTFLGEEMRLANAMETLVLYFVIGAECAALEAFAYGRALGFDYDVIGAALERVPHSVGRFLAYATPKLTSGDLTTKQATIDIWTLSSRGVVDAAQSLGLSAEIIRTAADTIAAAKGKGLGHLDLVALHSNISIADS